MVNLDCWVCGRDAYYVNTRTGHGYCESHGVELMTHAGSHHLERIEPADLAEPPMKTDGPNRYL